MASLEAKVNVDVSAVAHKAFEEVAAQIMRDYGVVIEAVDFKWNWQMDGNHALSGSNISTSHGA